MADQQKLPPSAREYASRQDDLTIRVTGAVQRQWNKVGLNPEAGWLAIAHDVRRILDEGQRQAITAAEAFVPAVIEDTGQSGLLGQIPSYRVNQAALIGVAGDGREAITLAAQAAVIARDVLDTGGTIHLAHHAGTTFLDKAIPTLLADTRRTVEKVSMNARGTTHWVRGLNPPSCGRCIILAGKRQRSSRAFLRHPGCDCISIPASEALPMDTMVNPGAYLDDLDDAALAKALGSKANARAYRDGADHSQLINAYRRSGDVRTAQVYGRSLRITTEGVTRRGAAYRAMSQAGYATRQTDTRQTGSRYFQSRAPRLMPQSLYEIAGSPAEAERLLRLYGWII